MPWGPGSKHCGSLLGAAIIRRRPRAISYLCSASNIKGMMLASVLQPMYTQIFMRMHI